MRLIAAVPIITTPVRLGLAAGPALAGHPGTKLAGWAIADAATRLPIWSSPIDGATRLNTHTGALVVLPCADLAQRLGMNLPQNLLRAEDACRLWGEPFWHADAHAIYARISNEPARRQAITLCRDLQRHLDLITDLLTIEEWEAYQCHRAINERGLHIERDVVRWLQQIIKQREVMRSSALGSAFQRTTMTVTEALQADGPLDRLLAHNSLTLTSHSEDALLELIASDRCPPHIAAVLIGLVGHGRITKVKVERLCEEVDDDDQLRHQFVMWAARTWRFSSQGTQVQNLPKPVEGANYSTLAGIAIEGIATASGQAAPEILDQIAQSIPSGRIDDAFPALLRMCFMAKPNHDLIVLDWNAIEPRIRAWLSDDKEHLEAWATGRDLYSELISGIVGRPITKATDPHLRKVGKIADIGCGYHMGADSFADLCAANDINLAKLGVTADHVVRRYRSEYWALSGHSRGLWVRLEDGAIEAVRTRRHVTVGRIQFAVTADNHLDMILPSGCRRRWWNATIQMRSPPWAKPGDHTQDRPVVVVAQTPEGAPDQVMYGGRILENACQAIGRDILITLLVELHRRGIPVVAHCHDEVVIEVGMEAAQAVLLEAKSLAEKPPSWAADLPLRVEAFISPFWSKEQPVK